MPQKYTTIKDDLPGMLLNTLLCPDSENPRTLPMGYDYDVPLSLNAESCLSEFRNIDRKPITKKNSNISANNGAADEDMEDSSDFLYNAYSEA